MKMYKTILVGVLCMCNMLPSLAQWRRSSTPNDSLISTEILGGNKVVFRIYAPEAKKIDFGGDIWGAEVNFVKDSRGVWEGVLEKLNPGAYRYHFIVDGVKVYDPKAPEASETSAILKVEPNDNEFFSMKNVPHGAMAQRYYYSNSLDTIRRLHVWTPAGYEKSADKLPVLYLVHGGGDTDNSWPTVGCAGFILDNLLAEGRMKPMIVVMPNGTIHTNSLEGEVPLFAEELMNDIIPYIEDNYRVLTDKDSRALAGLSMGGLETLEAGLNHYQKFGYLYVLSSGWFANDTQKYTERGAYLKKIASDFNKSVRLLAFTQGGPEDIAYKNCKAMLKLFDEAGVKYEFSEASGGHSWYTWRNDLYNLAQRIFK